MTDRKFTPPTEFPAEYVDGRGNRVVILGRSHHEVYPLIGFTHDGDVENWTEDGTVFRDLSSIADLHDIPKRIATWHNVYANQLSRSIYNRAEVDSYCGQGRLCVYRIERDEDGGNPEIFVEDV